MAGDEKSAAQPGAAEALDGLVKALAQWAPNWSHPALDRATEVLAALERRGTGRGSEKDAEARARKRLEFEARNDLLELVRKGEKTSAIAAVLRVSAETARHRVRKAKSWERYGSDGVEDLNPKTRHCLRSEGLMHADAVGAAFRAGRLKGIPNFGPACLEEVRVWLIDLGLLPHEAGSSPEWSDAALRELLGRRRKGESIQDLATDLGVSEDNTVDLLIKAENRGCYEKWVSRELGGLSPQAARVLRGAGWATVGDARDAINSGWLDMASGMDDAIKREIVEWVLSKGDPLEEGASIFRTGDALKTYIAERCRRSAPPPIPDTVVDWEWE